MEYEEWEKTAASPFHGDPIWRMTTARSTEHESLYWSFLPASKSNNVTRRSR
jgi:hypothetical protein